MKKFKYEFEVDDDFEKGCCFDCPMHEWVDYDDGDGYSETDLRCVLGSSYSGCPLEEVKEQTCLKQVKNLSEEEVKELKEMIELMVQATTLKEMHDRIR